MLFTKNKALTGYRFKFQSLNTAQTSAAAKTINAKVLIDTPSRLRPTATSPSSMKIRDTSVMNSQCGLSKYTDIKSASTLPRMRTPVLSNPSFAE